MKHLTLSDFSRLPHARWIWNAAIPLKPDFWLSVSFDDGVGLWVAGQWDSFEAAIMVGSTETRTLVTVGGENTFSGCDHAELERLEAIAMELVRGPDIAVFDQFQGNKEPRWGHRLATAEGEDLADKLDYCRRLWSPEHLRTTHPTT